MRAWARQLKATFLGVIVLVVATLAWIHLSYDRLSDWHSEWFYRVNALVHEHPEPNPFLDPVFLIAAVLGAVATVGPACFVVAWYSPQHVWKPAAVVVVLAVLPYTIRQYLRMRAGWMLEGYLEGWAFMVAAYCAAGIAACVLGRALRGTEHDPAGSEADAPT